MVYRYAQAATYALLLIRMLADIVALANFLFGTPKNLKKLCLQDTLLWPPAKLIYFVSIPIHSNLVSRPSL